MTYARGTRVSVERSKTEIEADTRPVRSHRLRAGGVLRDRRRLGRLRLPGTLLQDDPAHAGLHPIRGDPYRTQADRSRRVCGVGAGACGNGGGRWRCS